VDMWLGLGLFLMGAGAGALLTAISYISRIRKLRAEIEAASEKDRCAAMKMVTFPRTSTRSTAPQLVSEGGNSAEKDAPATEPARSAKTGG
jgi:hypothetical protein